MRFAGVGDGGLCYGGVIRNTFYACSALWVSATARAAHMMRNALTGYA